MRSLLPLAATAALTATLILRATPPASADVAPAINALGLDLYRQQIKSADGHGVLLSPYSISTALAMTYAGAAGATQAEMQRVLHFPADPAAGSAAFALLAEQLADLVKLSEERVAARHDIEPGAAPLQLSVANRLFVQHDYALRPAFTQHLATHFASTVEPVDFARRAPVVRAFINGWVAQQTHDRITDLLPAGQPTADTRLALVNALYLRARWETEFKTYSTRPAPFHLTTATTVAVPTMCTERTLRYAHRDGYSIVALRYETSGLQCVLFVPDTVDGLADLEQKLTAADLTSCNKLGSQLVQLHLPKFKLAPATMPLKDALLALGLRSAFDQPRGSANFDGIAPRRDDDYLALGEVFHKTWLSLDEHGTEAAAATAVLMAATGSAPLREPPKPVIVRADRPFLFAIQHNKSGACLFLGRVTDPR